MSRSIRTINEIYQFKAKNSKLYLFFYLRLLTQDSIKLEEIID